ncbi:MAG TPA: RDD family protein [Actinomycetes bacterium]|nr:RDD family protein [Actinomycetes bacterium]
MEQAGGSHAARPRAVAPPGARVVTPEAVSLQFETANVGSRGVAFMLDGGVVAAGLLVIFMALGAVAGLAGGDLPAWLGVSLLLVIVVAWMFGYFIAQETLWRGRTLGKAALGLRVVTREGGPVRFRHALIRTLLLLVDLVLSLGFVAVATILLSRANQRLGDMVAGTLVLRERSGSRPPAPVVFAAPPGLEPYVALLDTGRLDQQEYQTVRAFLLRAAELAPQARARLALGIATPLAARVRPAPPDGLPPEVFLQAVAAAYQLRQRPPGPPPGAAWPGWGPPAAGPGLGGSPAWPAAGGGGPGGRAWNGAPPAGQGWGPPAPPQPAAADRAPAAPGAGPVPPDAARAAPEGEHGAPGGGFTPPD